nr:hypothetical protein CFP56_42927 [Quercus suber]
MGGLVETYTDTRMSEAEFCMGWARTDSKGLSQTGKPIKGASKGKQQIRPKVESEEQKRGNISGGSWKRRARQSPIKEVDPLLNVGAGTKRKPEDYNPNLLHVNMYGKKTKVLEAWSYSKVPVLVAKTEGTSFMDVMWQLLMIDGGSDEVAARVLTIAWALWQNRNAIRLGGGRKSGQKLVRGVLDYLAEFGAAMEM